MIRILLFFFLFFAPFATVADPISIQIGDHNSYTRLVLVLSNDMTWTSESRDDRYILKFDPNAGIEFAPIEQELVDSRIEQIQTNNADGTLTVEFDCDCNIHDYLLGKRFLTIDFRENSHHLETGLLEQVFRGIARPWHQTMIDQPIILIDTTSHSPSENQFPLDTEIPSGIARAAYEGFLSLRNAHPSENPELVAPASPQVLDNINVGVRSQRDARIFDTDTDSPNFPCIEVHTELFEKWKSPESYIFSLGTQRRKLSNNVHDSSAFLELAIISIGQGFGVEAQKYVDEAMNHDTELHQAIAFIAQTIDGDVSPVPIDLHLCTENLIFWSFLHTEGPDDPLSDARPSVLFLYYKSLPDMLKQRLYRQFFDALGRAGQGDYQSELTTFENTTRLVRSQHSHSQSQPKLANSDSPIDPHDILQTEDLRVPFETYPENQLDISNLDLPLLETMRVTHRSTPTEYLVLDEVLKRHVENGEYEIVIQRLLESADRLSADRLDELIEKHVYASVKKMNDAEILAFAFRSDLPSLGKNVIKHVRTRLLSQNISAPPIFQTEDINKLQVQDDVDTIVGSEPFHIPAVERIQRQGTPSALEAANILENSAEIRNTIETLIDDIE